MRRLVETSVFTAMSCAILVSLFGLTRSKGATSSGDGGEALVSLEAAAPTVAEMVETWERPPQIHPVQDPDPTTPPDISDMPALPTFTLAEAPRAEFALAALSQPEQDILEVDTQTAAPPPKVEKPQPKPIETAAAQPQPEPPEAPEAPEAERKTPPTPKQPTPAPETQAAAKAQQTTAGRAEQRAAGTGGNTQAGAAGGAAASTKEAGQHAKLKNVWGAKIRARVVRYRRYPSGTNTNGRAVVRLTVGRDGKLIHSSLAQSSGDPVLDQAALSAVLRAKRFPKAPRKLPDQQIKVSIPMSFTE